MSTHKPTGSSQEMGADEILERLFGVILDEARRRPDFAHRLVDALPVSAVARIEKSARPQPAKYTFNPNAFSLVAVLQTQGEDGLLRQLNPIDRKERLREIAKAQHIPLTGKAAQRKATLGEIRAALVRGAKARLAGREAAAS
jgi:hypothetical protein